MEINCTIKSILFQNPDNGYTILNVENEDTGKNDTVIATMMEPMLGMSIRASGDWVCNQKYGRQFLATEWEEKTPTSLKGIELYLSSGLVKGIGPIFAKMIVDKFGMESLNVLNNDPERLLEIRGIGQKKYESIVSEWKKQSAVRELMIFLKKYDVKTGIILKIYKRYKGRKRKSKGKCNNGNW